jgi:hypothetical protein
MPGGVRPSPAPGRRGRSLAATFSGNLFLSILRRETLVARGLSRHARDICLVSDSGKVISREQGVAAAGAELCVCHGVTTSKGRAPRVCPLAGAPSFASARRRIPAAGRSHLAPEVSLGRISTSLGRVPAQWVPWRMRASHATSSGTRRAVRAICPTCLVCTLARTRSSWAECRAWNVVHLPEGL